MYYVSETFNVTASLINDTWDEYTINWLNKPEHNEIITTITVAEGKIYKIDITNYIEGRDYISICLNASDYYQKGYVQGHSREGYWSFSPEDAPQLIWTYSEIAEIAIKSPKENDKWEDFNDYSIRWSSKGSISRVKIQLYKGTTFVEDITYSYTDNDGEYDFHIWSSEDYYGTNYRIKITDYDDSRVYDYSDYFSINVYDFTTTFLDWLILLWIFLPIIIIGGFIAIIIIFIKKRQPKPEKLSTSKFDTQPKQISTQRSEQIKDIIAFCPNCGNKVRKGERFCIKCGNEL